MSEENKNKKKNTLKRVFAANQVAGEIIKKRNNAINEAVETVEPLLRKGAAVGMAIGVGYAKKERKNIKEFSEKSNRGVEVKPKEKELNYIKKDNISIKKNNAFENAKNFAKNK